MSKYTLSFSDPINRALASVIRSLVASSYDNGRRVSYQVRRFKTRGLSSSSDYGFPVVVVGRDGEDLGI